MVSFIKADSLTVVCRSMVFVFSHLKLFSSPCKDYEHFGTSPWRCLRLDLEAAAHPAPGFELSFLPHRALLLISRETDGAL